MVALGGIVSVSTLAVDVNARLTCREYMAFMHDQD